MKEHYREGEVKKRIQYKDGMRDGLQKKYYPYPNKNKVKCATPYKLDVIHGERKKWSLEGRLLEKKKYIMGSLKEKITYKK